MKVVPWHKWSFFITFLCFLVFVFGYLIRPSKEWGKVVFEEKILSGGTAEVNIKTSGSYELFLVVYPKPCDAMNNSGSCVWDIGIDPESCGVEVLGGGDVDVSQCGVGGIGNGVFATVAKIKLAEGLTPLNIKYPEVGLLKNNTVYLRIVNRSGGWLNHRYQNLFIDTFFILHTMAIPFLLALCVLLVILVRKKL